MIRKRFSDTSFIFQSGDNPSSNRPLQKALRANLPGRFVTQAQVEAEFPCEEEFHDVYARLNSLKNAVQNCTSSDIVLVARSSGGRVATMLAATSPDPRISAVICFSYPFRHPKKPPEPERVSHLSTLRIPTLIFQGDQDPYGGEGVGEMYPLSPDIRFRFVPGDHSLLFEPKLWNEIIVEILSHALAARESSDQLKCRGHLSPEVE